MNEPGKNLSGEAHQEVEKDICIDCGNGIDKPKPVQVTPFMLMQPLSLCPRCDEVWRWRGQICVERCPYRKPLWRTKRLTRNGDHGTYG